MIDNRKNRRRHGMLRRDAKAWYVILQCPCCKYEELHVFVFDNEVGYDMARRAANGYLGEYIDASLHSIYGDWLERVLELRSESTVTEIHFQSTSDAYTYMNACRGD